MTVEMLEKKGPHFPEPLLCPDDVKKLDINVDMCSKLKYVLDAITLTRHGLQGEVPLFGFVGGPWTLMAYMIEGGGSKTLSRAKSWLFMHKEESCNLLQILTDKIVEFLIGQVRAGAQVIVFRI